MDVLNKEQRHKNMAAIKSGNTKPEVYLRKLLFSRGFRYRLHSKHIPGKPDLWLKKYNTAVFVNGCYWHRHVGCKYASNPKSNTEFWKKKFESNIRRDHAVRQQLREKNIRYLDIWECTIKEMKKNETFRNRVLDSIALFLNSDESHMDL